MLYFFSVYRINYTEKSCKQKHLPLTMLPLFLFISQVRQEISHYAYYTQVKGGKTFIEKNHVKNSRFFCLFMNFITQDKIHGFIFCINFSLSSLLNLTLSVFTAQQSEIEFNWKNGFYARKWNNDYPPSTWTCPRLLYTKAEILLLSSVCVHVVINRNGLVAKWQKKRAGNRNNNSCK